MYLMQEWGVSLNPLKSSYDYDDTAREYLNGMLLPSKEDLLGKETYETAWEKEKRSLVFMRDIWRMRRLPAASP